VEVAAELDVVDVERVVGMDDEVDEAVDEELTDEDVLLGTALETEDDVLLATLELDDTELEVEVGAEELELETMTGFTLLYIDNRLAPPHYSN
jgi:hypothetical protein